MDEVRHCYANAVIKTSKYARKKERTEMGELEFLRRVVEEGARDQWWSPTLTGGTILEKIERRESFSSEDASSEVEFLRRVVEEGRIEKWWSPSISGKTILGKIERQIELLTPFETRRDEARKLRPS